MFSKEEKCQSAATRRSQDNSRHHRGRKKQLGNEKRNNDFFLVLFRAPAIPKSRNFEYYVTKLFHRSTTLRLSPPLFSRASSPLPPLPHFPFPPISVEFRLVNCFRQNLYWNYSRTRHFVKRSQTKPKQANVITDMKGLASISLKK